MSRESIRQALRHGAQRFCRVPPVFRPRFLGRRTKVRLGRSLRARPGFIPASLAAVLGALVFLTACGEDAPTEARRPETGTGPEEVRDAAWVNFSDSAATRWDASPSDGGLTDGGAVTWCRAGTPEACDNLDNDCDGVVDEGCGCTVPEKPCYSGNPADLEVAGAACRQGVQACELEFYGECKGEVTPRAETCDGIDNDCDGVADDNLPDCNNNPPVAQCPPDQVGRPLSVFSLAGGYSDPDGDVMRVARWTFVSRPAGSTSNIRPAEGLDATFFADLQGEYVLQLEVQDEQGSLGRCTTKVSTAASDDQLRVEMVWNPGLSGDPSDVDLHLLKGGGRWFSESDDGDDCFYRNCKVCNRSGDSIEATESLCRSYIASLDDPPPQVMWSAPLDENDPRLDLDDVQGNGPENINIRSPRDGTYRVGVHFYADDGQDTATVSVKVFCGERLAREFEPVVLTTPGEFWEVADIVWQGGGCGVSPLGTQACPRVCSRAEAEAGGCPSGQTRGHQCP